MSNKLSNSNAFTKSFIILSENYHSFESLGILKEIRSWIRLQGLLESLFIKMTKFWILVVVMEILFFASKSFPNCTFYGYEIAQKIEYNKGRLIIIKGSKISY